MESCNLKTGVCESSSSASSCGSQSCESKCSCGGCCGGDPVVCAMMCWKGAFNIALKQVMVDILKAKIQKSYGAKFDKAADAVMGAMETKWQAKMMMAKSKSELMEKLKEEMCKK